MRRPCCVGRTRRGRDARTDQGRQGKCKMSLFLFLCVVSLEGDLRDYGQSFAVVGYFCFF